MNTDNKIDVLDKGYVRLVDTMGDDLSVVNAARVSFAKESEEFSKGDASLVNFLAKNGHYSPFRHAFLTFEVNAPMMVTRQWWKYIVGSDHTMDGWNESSRRYVTSKIEFYRPDQDEWRSAADDAKQGSGGPLGPWDGSILSQALDKFYHQGEELYEWAIENMNVAPEQARLFLPGYGMYLLWRWSCSLQSVSHFLNERLKGDAQHEINSYADAVYQLVQPKFPVSINALVAKDVVY